MGSPDKGGLTAPITASILKYLFFCVQHEHSTKPQGVHHNTVMPADWVAPG